MLGAIIGDLAGSVYEYPEVKTGIDLERRKEILTKDNIIDSNSFYSDDTILTLAILNSILNDISYEENLKKYGLKYYKQVPKDIPYFEYLFSPGFVKWCKGADGKSYGNGALMRISPVAYLFNTKEEILAEAEKATIPSHNTKETLEAVRKMVLVIYYARRGLTLTEIKKIIPYEKYDIDYLRENYLFDGTYNVINPCLSILFDSVDFEDAIRKIISIGGDTDTNACIVGAMAEAIFGIPNDLKNQALEKLPYDFQRDLEEGYQKVRKI